MSLLEEVFLPSDQVKCVDIVNAFLSFIHLSLNPVTVEVTEEVVDVFCGGSVSVPFSDVEGEKALFSMAFGSRVDSLEVIGKVLGEECVEFFS